jgi:hypothetical protein
VAKAGTSKAGGTISQQAAVHIRGLLRTPTKKKKKKKKKKRKKKKKKNTVDSSQPVLL